MTVENPDSSRPEFHFTPERHWINDPNGLVYVDGEYHLFFQHNPLADAPGNISWGHAVSRDLLHWDQLPVAIPFQGGIMAFSGCAVVDWENSSGLGIDGQPPLVIAFTGHHDGKSLEDQRLAYSTDRGRSWNLYAGNPVLDINQKDFRDPKVFWHAPSQRWIMVLVLANDYRVQFYGSSDLKSWSHLSDFGPAGSVGGVWEVPELFELPINGDPTRTRWVLKVDVGAGGPFGGSAGQYFIGQFDGQRFVPDDPQAEPNWIDGGKDFYAAVSWSDLPAQDGRRIWLAWMSNWQYAHLTPTRPWRGMMSIPRTVTLQQIGNEIRLVQQPVRELERARGEHYSLSGALLEGARPLPIRGDALEIIAEFEPSTATEFGLKLRVGQDAETLVGYDALTQSLYVDRSRSGSVDFSPEFPGRHSAQMPAIEGRVSFHVFVDACSVEVFANGGRTVISDLIFPRPEDDSLELYAVGGQARLVSLEAWALRPKL